MRRVLFWTHLGAGILAGLLILFFAVTGMLIAYERPLLLRADRGYLAPRPGSEPAAVLPLAERIAATERRAGAAVTSVTLLPGPGQPIALETEGKETYYAGPGGEPRGPASPRLRRFFSAATGLHRWFGLEGAGRRRATAVKGSATLLFLFLAVSGALLWLPARWTRAALGVGLVPRLRLRGRARDYNWHKVAGAWCGLPLAVIALTGVIMAFPGANALLFRAAGSAPPARRESGRQAPGRAGSPAGGAGPGALLPEHLDEAFRLATAAVPGWQSASLRLPAAPGPLAFSVERSQGGHPERHVQVLVDAGARRVVARTPFSALSRGQRWRMWVRFVHTGEAGGLWGETVAVAACLGTVILVVTGFLLSLERLRSWRRATARRAETLVDAAR